MEFTNIVLGAALPGLLGLGLITYGTGLWQTNLRIASATTIKIAASFILISGGAV